MNPHSQNQPISENVQTPMPIPTAPPSSPKKQPSIPSWRFWLVVMAQVLIILGVPARHAVTYFTGRTIVLQTIPVDPYDFLRGYSQTLRYTISEVNTLKSLPGASQSFADCQSIPDCSFYVVLETPTGAAGPSPQPWKPVQVTRMLPTGLPAHQIALKGNYQGWRIEYGLERYYMPEDQRNQINNDIRQLQQTNQRAFLVEVKVDAQGQAVPVSLWVGDRRYQF